MAKRILCASGLPLCSPRSTGFDVHSAYSYILSRSSLGRSKKRNGCLFVGVGEEAREVMREDTAEAGAVLATEAIF